MKLVIVAVKDRATDSFNRPFFVPSIGAAMRSFQDEVNRVAPDNIMNQHPDDFDLYEFGTFDDSSGEFDLIHAPLQVCLGKQMRLPV